MLFKPTLSLTTVFPLLDITSVDIWKFFEYEVSAKAFPSQTATVNFVDK